MTLEELEAVVAGHTTQIDGLTANVGTLGASVASTQTDLGTVTARVTATEDSVAAVTARVDALEGGVGTMATVVRGFTSAAVQTALNAGGWVVVPPGIYPITDVLQFQPNTHLTLQPGAILERAGEHGVGYNGEGTAGPGGYGGRGNITVDGGGMIDGKGVEGAAAGIYVCMLSFGHAQDITIRDIVIKDVPGMHAFEINSSQTVRIENVKFRGFVPKPGDTVAREAVQLDAANSPTGFGFGPYDSTPCRDVRVTGCWFGASGTPGTVPWPRGVGSHGGLDTTKPRHSLIQVDHNVFDGVTDAAVRGWWWDQSTIHDNAVDQSAGDGIVLEQVTNTDLHHNRIYDSGRNGILISNSSNIRAMGDAPVGSGAGVNNTYDDVRVLNSAVVDLTGLKARKRGGPLHARWGLYIDSASSKVYRYGSRYQGAGVSGPVSDNSLSPVTSASDATT